MKKKIGLFLSVLFTLQLSLFAEISLLSPVPGNWSNKQMLVIQNDTDGDFFYSVDGSDPEQFGFAYDGPVLLDVTGNVKLRIGHIKSDNSREKTEVLYNVTLDEALVRPYGSFISTFFDSGLINYSAGTVISIPEELYCSIGMYSDSFFLGDDLSLAPNCILNRYVPVTLMDSTRNLYWRFMVRTFPQNAGIFSRRDVPFEITDWETITFTDDNLIYKIDSNYWELPTESKILDRSVSHMISWQSISYEHGNPIEFFILPPKPQLKSSVSDDGSVVFYLDGDDSYTISVYGDESKGYEELFSQIGADVFYGDKASGTLRLGIFASSVYQGEMTAEYHINKRPPEIPEIVTSAHDFYSRKKVTVDIGGDFAADCDLYVAVSEPMLLSDPTFALDANNEIFDAVKLSSFEKAENGHYSVELESKGEGASYYKIVAYSANDTKQSLQAVYSVIVDQYNYYYDDSADSALADGTAIHPYTNFKQCLEAINESRNVCLNVKGTLYVPEGSNILLANAEVKTGKDGEIVFAPGASLVVKNSTLDITNCKILNSASPKYKNTVPLFKLENSVLTFSNCICAGSFNKNGNIFEVLNSILNISDSMISSIGVTYASCITSINSKINIKKSTLTASADTCVILSAHEGTLNSNANIFKVFGKNGRIGELFGVKGEIVECQFNAELLKNTVSVSPIYKNTFTVLKEENNASTGF